MDAICAATPLLLLSAWRGQRRTARLILNLLPWPRLKFPGAVTTTLPMIPRQAIDSLQKFCDKLPENAAPNAPRGRSRGAEAVFNGYEFGSRTGQKLAPPTDHDPKRVAMCGAA